ncbi:MAG: acetylgalactosaminidase [Candidatus Aminicenantes bacterium RBG_16_63_16]|nr:MAG: acetylgalactosaminidase [Candidatus Aminicenantes bacterium RBG_16_63_16]
MKTNRREFLKAAGLSSLGIAGGAWAGWAAEGSIAGGADLPGWIKKQGQTHKQRFNMSGYRAPKIPTVRVGIIGLGQRGPAHMSAMSNIEGVDVKAMCDLRPEKAEEAKRKLAGTGHDPELYAGSAEVWKRLCERDDLDLVIITTPWYMHAEMAVYAMEHGRHVASEVPAAGTLEECWRLVETSERTRRHLMMMENYAYLEFQLLTLNLARQGFFGEVVHGEGAYNTSKMANNFSKSLYWDMWWLKQYARRKGNIYPTHGLGPVCQVMDINRGDRLDFLVSVESNDFMMRERARELAETDDFFKPFVRHDYRGNMNVTTIRTKKGRTIMLQHDAASPSPHNLIHGIYGTSGAALFDPPPPRLSVGQHEWVSQEEFEKLKEKYTPELTRKMAEISKTSGHGGSDIKICWRLIDCLHNGLPLDQDVYDAAAWSSIVPLSEWSVRNRSNSIDVPDFTAEAWVTNKRNMDINLESGGNTKMVSR